MTPRLMYRIVAIAEVITWALLISSMIVKYAFSGPAILTTIAGGIHGFVFISYAATAVLVGVNQRWRLRLIVGAVATAIIPFATLPFDIWLDRRGLLEGGWRTEATDDPRDQHWTNRFLSWLLRHPAILVVAGVALIVIIMVVLLLVGPPGGSH